MLRALSLLLLSAEMSSSLESLPACDIEEVNRIRLWLHCNPIARAWWILWIPTNDDLCTFVCRAVELGTCISWLSVDECVRTKLFDDLDIDLETG